MDVGTVESPSTRKRAPVNVLMLSPGFPAEMPHFTRGLAEVGARVIGIGDQPEASVPEHGRRHLSAYVRADSFADEAGMVATAKQIASRVTIDRVECLWEPLMVAAARMREELGLPGMTVTETIPFRDKEAMKVRLDEAGIRTPRHGRAHTADQCREAAEDIGYPLILKPIAGAGSQDTYRVDDAGELEDALARLGHIAEVSIEEYIDGDDYTFDTVTVEGEILYDNIAFYRPRALVNKSGQWISPQTICRRDVEGDAVAAGREMGRAVHAALGVQTGFTHMEWFRTTDGEAVFCEIGARSPGARTVDLMNFASDIDLFRGWAEAVCHGCFTQPVERKYNSAGIFKRAHGQGVVRRIEGLDRVLATIGHHVCAVELTGVGEPAKDWRRSIVGDGFVMLRHPDLETTLEMADFVGTTLQLYAD